MNYDANIPTDAYSGPLMVTVFALTTALLYGSADFLGGAATRRAHVLSVLLVSGYGRNRGRALLRCWPGARRRRRALPGGSARARQAAWGSCSSMQGLAAGPMTVVAPISALASTVLPVAAALAVGERLVWGSVSARWPASSRSCW